MSSTSPPQPDDFSLSYPDVVRALGVSRRTVQRYVNQRSPFALDVKSIYVPDGPDGNTRRALLFSASQVAELKRQMNAHKGAGSTEAARPLDAQGEANAPHPVLALMHQLSQATDLIVKKDEEIAKLNHALGQYQERATRLESETQRWVDHYKSENARLTQAVDESLLRRQQLADAARRAMASSSSWRIGVVVSVLSAGVLMLGVVLWRLLTGI